MTASLSKVQINRYHSMGYLCPLRVMSRDDAAHFLNCYQEYTQSVAEQAKHLPARDQYLYFAETHAYLPWVYQLATYEAILDAVESILGSNLLLWDSRWFTKPVGSHSYVSWHQDGTYWSLDPPRACTAWLALTNSCQKNGAMRLIPESHLGDALPHRDTFAEDNALARGQEIAVEVDESRAVDMELEPGEISVHHTAVVHGSGVNRSHDARIGIALRFVPTEVRQQAAKPLAMLVRGQDSYGHFELLEPPTDPHPAIVAQRRKRVVERVYGNLLPLTE